MKYDEARNMVQETFENEFNQGRYDYFVRNLLDMEIKPFTRNGVYIPRHFTDHVKKYQRIGKYTDPQGRVMDVLVVYLRRETALERARAMQRNFVAWYLNDKNKDAALVAFQAEEAAEWRFSFVRLGYSLTSTPDGNLRVQRKLTEARRYSFLVGKGEPSHTAQQHLIPLLINDDKRPTLETIEQAFSIERVTDQFFLEYKQLFEKLKAELERIIKKDSTIRREFERKEVDKADFSKKLLGQLIFLYFLQKKGWLGVEKNEAGEPADWGSGPRDFLRQLFNKKNYRNFFNDVLEPLFYDTLAVDRRKEQDWCALGCRIPFLNGGLFEPIKNYDWKKTDILLPNSLFAEIFEVFDRYNFTVKEDEPLEKEVAVDPEMLGKVFERLLDSVDQKAKGAFYTPRQIVHYICQQCLISYLARGLAGSVDYDDIVYLVRRGEYSRDVEQAVRNGRLAADSPTYGDSMLPESVKSHALAIDRLLADIKICDPAIGSGAFPVGMMQEIIRVRGILNTELPSGNERTPYHFKRHAIETSLYGVDIDASAVDIAKLRLWLSLVVDEENVRDISPLPNLDYKIMQGDSLLENYKGITLFDQELALHDAGDIGEEIKLLEARVKEKSAEYMATFSKQQPDRKLQQAIQEEINHYEKRIKDLKSLQKGSRKPVVVSLAFEGLDEGSKSKKQQLQDKRALLFNETDKARKDELKLQIEDLVWDFIRTTLKEQGKADLVPEVEQYRLSNHRPFMLWRLHFDEVFDRENGGFDVVIGNPPYVSNKMVDKEFQGYYRAVYGLSDDLYNYFFIKAFDIARQGGIIAYISSNTYFTLQTKQNLRRLFQDNRVLEIIKTENVFQNAMVEPAIIVVVKEDMRGQDYELVFKDAVDDFEQPQIYPVNIATYARP
ncbi:Eco57I restriction-modification methylase domain-containing protein [Syntrophomonas palmitatica]|uniref:Eco57I restriction-modification methylase domain-containing protein n=1 Tax=Syntrophomonas palmitatica TaxID=402877 RepID=UPI0006D1630E|nr:N-6 DNA methylase [Syntrophomonas palmitatica]